MVTNHDRSSPLVQNPDAHPRAALTWRDQDILVILVDRQSREKGQPAPITRGHQVESVNGPRLFLINEAAVFPVMPPSTEGRRASIGRMINEGIRVTDGVSTRNRIARRVLSPIQEFIHAETAGGVILLIFTVAAMIWANSPWEHVYTELWEIPLTAGLGSISLSMPLELWINDGLMAIFFFVVGLEIKREILVGELASPRQAMLPISAAIGGMLVPAAIYFAINAGGPGAAGWGVPMATDIAFVLGVLALLGNRVPTSLKVFLTALAIVDDLGAVLVIALFYTAEISWISLAIGAGVLGLLIGANRMGIRNLLVYGLLGIGLWLAFLHSGVHPTIAGVLLAMTIPARTRIDADELLSKGRSILEEFERSGGNGNGNGVLRNHRQQEALLELMATSRDAETPLQRLEHSLHAWVAFVIMPVFALVNAGVALHTGVTTALSHAVTLGVIAGLVAGKQLGITLAAWLVIRSGLTSLPSEVTWRHIYGAGWLGGIGFTMSLFIAGLAFAGTELLLEAKVGIMAASILAGSGGWLILRGSHQIEEEAENASA